MRMEFLNLISQGGMVSLIVAAILLAMSVSSWTVMAIKAIQLRAARRQNALFLKSIFPQDSRTGSFNHQCQFNSGSTLFQPDKIRQTLADLAGEPTQQTANAYARLTISGLTAFDQQVSDSRLRLGATQAHEDFVAHSLRRALGNESIQLENGLTLLATVGSIAPFVGLFGTVWGIYHALGAIALGGQVTVDKVAGPVGEALIMTAFGLAVAMPAVLAYNAFIRDNRLLLTEIENFAHDLYASLTIGAAPTRVDKAESQTADGEQFMKVLP